MPGLAKTSESIVWRALARLDALMNRLYGWRYNPLYQSGALAVALLLVVLVTGLYLLIFYRIGSPYASVAGLTDQVWAGRWIRCLHRYASDAAVLAVAVHMFRMFAQGRTWGPRALAWITGLIALGTILFCGWTGYVMIWDVPGQVLAMEGARYLDTLPIFSEPISRAFVGESEIPSAFFFLNLFLHVAVPVGLGLLLWLHVSRVARATLLPPKMLLWGSIALLTLVSVAWPVGMAQPADLFRLPGPAPYDFFYLFWLPISQALPTGVGWLVMAVLLILLFSLPLLTRPKVETEKRPSAVDERFCTGCEQCYLDCPYEAIEMIGLPDGRVDYVARVDPALCVSCGICAGSCAPMGVGPPGRTGRNQLGAARRFSADHPPHEVQVVVIGCEVSGARAAAESEGQGVVFYPVSCAGSVHTSVIEYFLREGAAGVLVAACPPRDCWNREGSLWVNERMYNDREAELQERVSRERVRLVYSAWAEPHRLEAEIESFRRSLSQLVGADREGEDDLIRLCDLAREEAET